jgi:hypothetical protein
VNAAQIPTPRTDEIRHAESVKWQRNPLARSILNVLEVMERRCWRLEKENAELKARRQPKPRPVVPGHRRLVEVIVNAADRIIRGDDSINALGAYHMAIGAWRKSMEEEVAQ